MLKYLKLFLLLLWCGSVHSHVESIEGHPHKQGFTYTSLGVYNGGVKLLYTAPVTDLHTLGPGTPDDLLPIVAAGIVLKDGSSECWLLDQQATEYAAINAYQFTLDYACDGPEILHIGYNLFEHDPEHINYVDIVFGAQPLRAIFSGSELSLTVPVQYMMEQSGWVLMDDPPHLTGKKPELVRYLKLGFDHVLSGWDHLAFVLGLVILARRFSSLALLITSFTIAHSITLAMAAMDVFVLPQALTELLIAVSIIYIGLENLWVLYRGNWRIPDDLSMSRRAIISFTFGLIHGFGFSFFLREMGLPPSTLLQGLALFNIGVELAQMCVVIVPFVILQRVLGRTAIFPVSSSMVSVAVLFFGIYLAFERIVL